MSTHVTIAIGATWVKRIPYEIGTVAAVHSTTSPYGLAPAIFVNCCKLMNNQCSPLLALRP